MYGIIYDRVKYTMKCACIQYVSCAVYSISNVNIKILFFSFDQTVIDKPSLYEKQFESISTACCSISKQ